MLYIVFLIIPSARPLPSVLYLRDSLSLLFVPGRLWSDIFRWGHCSNVACHPGVNRTSFLVKQRFWWCSMARDIQDFVLACSVCARGKTSNRPPEGFLQPLSVPSRPWSHIALDFVTALPPSQGNMVILTVVDRFSKAAHFIPLPKLPSAKETAVTVIDHVFRIHGLPMDVVSDRGPQFVSKFWKEFCCLLGASVSLSCGFHPQSNGQTERANQDLERVLRCLVAQNPASWSQQLSWVEYAHNLPVSSTGLSPFECSLGYQPPIFPSLESKVAVPSAHAFVQKYRHTWRRARETLSWVGACTKAQADHHRSMGRESSWRSCIGALLLFLRFPDVHRWIFCRILTTEFVAANLESEIKWPKFACRILYIVILNRFNILEVNSGRWIWIIEFLIMKMCVKYFELKYSQLK